MRKIGHIEKDDLYGLIIKNWELERDGANFPNSKRGLAIGEHPPHWLIELYSRIGILYWAPPLGEFKVLRVGKYKLDKNGFVWDTTKITPPKITRRSVFKMHKIIGHIEKDDLYELIIKNWGFKEGGAYTPNSKGGLKKNQEYGCSLWRLKLNNILSILHWRVPLSKFEVLRVGKYGLDKNGYVWDTSKRDKLSTKSDDFKLKIEPVPRSFPRLSLSICGKNWGTIRKKVYANANYTCEACGEKVTKLYCHEKWNYDDKKKIQKLEGVEALCVNCHGVIHVVPGLPEFDRSDLINHFCKVNNCRKDDFLKHEEEAFEIWEERSHHQWKPDFGKYEGVFKSSSELTHEYSKHHDIIYTVSDDDEWYIVRILNGLVYKIVGGKMTKGK